MCEAFKKAYVVRA